MTEKATNTMIIIDGNSLINRAYYAMQRPMITKDGIYTHAIYGFLNMLNRLIKDYEPTHIAVAFDLKEPTFRHKEYAEYKAGRKAMPFELAMQMPLLKDVLSAMNIKILELSGFEADDIIGTVAKKAEDEGLLPLIVTGDRDAFQLASEKTRVHYTKKGVSQFEIYDADKMKEVYGLTPAQFIDYKGLCGDKSDNIPGIPGVGEKTALELLAEFGNVESIIENSDKISKKALRQKVEDNAQLAILSKRLATINTNAPIDLDFNEMRYKEPDFEKLIDIYVKLEFNSFLKKINIDTHKNARNQTNGISNDTELNFNIDGEELTNADGSIDTLINDRENNIHNINSNSSEVSLKRNRVFSFQNISAPYDIDELKNEIRFEVENNGYLCIKVFSDGNHKDIPRILGISFVSNDKVYYINGQDIALIESFARFLSEEQIPLLGHGLKDDYYAILSNYTFDIKESIFNTFFDISIAEYLLEPTKSSYDMHDMALEYLHKEIMPFEKFMENNGQFDMFSDVNEKFAEYGMNYCASIINIYYVLNQKLKDDEMLSIAQSAEFPLIEVLASMEVEGFKLDTNALSDIGKKITERVVELTEEIYQMAGEEFNIRSPQQLGVILFEKLELPAGKKTKTGYSTNADVLEKLRHKHPIIELIIEYRMLTKLNSTYIEGLIPLKAVDGKIHAHFQQTVTATGRISCTEPNLQNIPVRQPLGRSIRRAFVPSDLEHLLVGADYSQIELRVLAHLSGEQNLIDAFNAGDDIHRLTAAKVFEVPYDEVTSLMRSNAKAVNFGVIYGMSSFGLSTELNISRRDAENYIKDYFTKYKDVKAFMDEQIRLCKERGYATTILNRKRRIHELKSSAFMVRSLGERLAMNTPIQGSAADIIKLAMILTYKEIRRNGLRSKLILQVHDELIIDTCKDEEEIITNLLTSSMEKAIELKVKLIADLNKGTNWYELK